MENHVPLSQWGLAGGGGGGGIAISCGYWPLQVFFGWVGGRFQNGLLLGHTCHKLWNIICEIRQKFKGDLTKLCEIFLNITLELPQYSLKPFFVFHVRSL